MIVVRGVGASKGIAIGQARLLGDTFVEALCVRIEDTDAEIKRLMQAHNTALTDLEQLYQKMNTTMDKDHAMIIKAHILLLKEDSTYISEIKSGIIGMKVNAEYAVKLASDKIRKQFGEMENEYMRERAADIKDISMRLTRLLMGQPVQWSSNRYRQEVLITNDLLPSETVDLDLNSVAAILCKEGSSMSHSSILARTMNIPSVVGLEKQLDSIEDGDELLIDGTTGTVYINPDKET
ncbi:MAG: phosphoenolpyruvate-utilizing N-terminal domain-containing protein, partial [Oscillospiraceae bacterium]